MAPAPPQAPAPGTAPKPPEKRPDLLAPMRTLRFWVMLAILLVANIVISNLAFSAGQPPTVTISYNTFLDQVPDAATDLRQR